jgi:DNA-directed RNA polymerases I, II, and III subunit RPABC3
MTSATSNIVFDDVFTINAIDKDGKKFDRGSYMFFFQIYSIMSDGVKVSRLYAHSKNYDMDLTLDYNVELFPLERDQAFALALASSLARGGSGVAVSGDAEEDAEEKDRDVWRPDGKGRRGLEEDYDYVMYGKVSDCFADLSLPLFIVFSSQVYKFDGVRIHRSRFTGARHGYGLI